MFTPGNIQKPLYSTVFSCSCSTVCCHCSSASGLQRFDTRVLMNLISLMCLCLLSPESLLLFNGVLQSYLISPLVVSPLTASLSLLLYVYWQHRRPTTSRSLQPVGAGRRTLRLIGWCCRAQKRP